MKKIYTISLSSILALSLFTLVVKAEDNENERPLNQMRQQRQEVRDDKAELREKIRTDRENMQENQIKQRQALMEDIKKEREATKEKLQQLKDDGATEEQIKEEMQKIREETKSKMDEFRKDAESKREEFRTDAKALFDKFKTDRKIKLTDEKIKLTKERLSEAFKKLTLALDNLTLFDKRVEMAITKHKAQGLDTSASENALNEARADLENTKISITETQKVLNEMLDSSSEISKDAVIDSLKKSRDSVKNTKDLYIKVLESLPKENDDTTNN